MKNVDTLGESRYLQRIYQKMNQKVDKCKSYQTWESIFPWQENWPKLR